MLEFYKWQILEVDPFYIPQSKEDIELNGMNIDAPNLAKELINSVRIRKGMTIDEKIVKDANKQSNIGKN